MRGASDTLQLDEPFAAPEATVRILPVGGCEQAAPRWIEVRAREYTFRLAYDPQADPGRSGQGAVLGLAGYMAQQLIGAELRECQVVFFFDGRSRLLGFCHIARGSMNVVRSTVSDVAFPALQLGAKAVVIAHNHPTGDLTPSRDDRLHAEALALGLNLVVIELLGSVVVGIGGWRTVWQSPHRFPRLTCDRTDDDAETGDAQAAG